MEKSDAVWGEEGTTPDAIAAALRRLLVERHAENDGYVPARVLNMIAFVDREWSGEIANRLRGVGRFHASRLLVLSYEPQRERLDARVMIASEGEPELGELSLLRETVVVEMAVAQLDDHGLVQQHDVPGLGLPFGRDARVGVQARALGVVRENDQARGVVAADAAQAVGDLPAPFALDERDHVEHARGQEAAVLGMAFGEQLA